MRLAICADHNAVDLKAQLVAWLGQEGHHVVDVGTHSTEVVDYPSLCRSVGELVTS